MCRLCVSVALFFLLACAVPQNNADFSIAPTGVSGSEFLSAQNLLVSGLVSESIGIATKGRLFDAEARLRKALVLAPSDPTIMYNLAVVLGQQGQTDEAIKLLQKLRATKGDHPRYAIAMADAYLGAGDLSKAREQLKLAFGAFSQVQNWPQAALVARSISNLAFAEGVEQEALCYSYEAFFLDPSAMQFGHHISILVGLNQYKLAEAFVEDQVTLTPALGASPRVHLARSLARGALGDTKGALNEIEVAQGLSSSEPELGAEVNVIWWLLKRQIPQTTEEIADEKLQESIKAAEPEAIRLKGKPTYAMVRWPRVFLDLLGSISDVEGENLASNAS